MEKVGNQDRFKPFSPQDLFKKRCTKTSKTHDLLP